MVCPRCNIEVPPGSIRCQICGYDQTLITGTHANQPREINAPVFAERYKIIEKIGSGGFGTVYRASDSKLRIDVALKLTNSALEDETSLKRFEREARVIAKLSHENIVKIFDFGIHNGVPFYTMEFVEGDTLQKVIEFNKILPVRVAMRIARDVALALHHAHINGVVHRDVKPHNIIIQPRTDEPTNGKTPLHLKQSFSSSKGVLSQFRVVLTDFGLAKDVASVTKISISGELMGTPFFMSPEQAGGQSNLVGPQSDVYSMGVVLYYMLTGRLPFDGDTLPVILQNIRMVYPPAARVVAPDIPRDVSAICEKSMEKDLSLRYKSALEFAQDCESYLRGETVMAKPPGLRVKAKRYIMKNKVPFAALASALIVGAGIIGYFGIVAPAIREYRAEKEFERKKETFLADKGRIEGEASRRTAEAEKLYAERKYTEAIKKAEEVISQSSKYSSASTFPKSEFSWNDQFALYVPFEIPTTDALLLIGRSRERLGDKPLALDSYTQAYYDGLTHGKADRALFELAYFFLRNEDFEQSRLFFQKLIDRYPGTENERLARYYIGFACGGTGDYQSAAAFLEASAIPPALDLHTNGKTAPLHEAGGKKEALWLYKMLSNRTEIADMSSFGSMANASISDIDHDGKSEIIVASKDGMEILKFVDGTMKRTRTLKFEDGKVPEGKFWWDDIDHDGIPECVNIAGKWQDGVGVTRIFKLDGDVLREVFNDSTMKSDGYATFADVDDDGIDEVLVSESWYARNLRVYKKWGNTFRVYLYHFGSDIESITVRDIDGDGKKDIIALTSKWLITTGYRIWQLKWDFDKNTIEQAASQPIGHVSRWAKVMVNSGGSATSIFYNTVLHAYEGRSLLKAYKDLSFEPEFGLYCVTFRDGAFSKPELIWGRRNESFDEDLPGYVFPLSDNSAFVKVGKSTRYFTITPERVAYISLRHFSDTWEILGYADVDGDSNKELILIRRGGIVAICGLGNSGGSSAASSIQQTDISREENLRSYQEALFTVSAHISHGDYDEAVAFLRQLAERFPLYEKEILMRIARVQQDRFQWKELVETLTRLKSRIQLADFERQELERWLDWVTRLVIMKDCITMDFKSVKDIPFLTDNPLRFRVDADSGTLKVFSNSNDPAFIAVPISFDGNPFTIESGFSVPRFDWGNRFRFRFTCENLLTDIEYMRGGRNIGEYFDKVAVEVKMGSDGATNSPTWRIGMLWSGPGMGEDLGKSTPTLVPGIASYSMRISCVDEIGKAYYVFDSGGKKVTADEASIKFRLYPSPAYFILGAGATFGSGEYWGEMDLKRLTLKSSGTITSREIQPKAISDFWLSAGGRFVRGDYDGALQAYKASLKMADDAANEQEIRRLGFQKIQDFRDKTDFFAVFAYGRSGNKEAARTLMGEMMNRGMEKVLSLFVGNFLGMTPEDRQFFREMFWASAAGYEYGFIFTTTVRLVALEPTTATGGCEVVEHLFFSEPKDPEIAMDALDKIESEFLARRMETPIFKVFILRSRGRILHQMGQPKNAKKCMDEALEVIKEGGIDEFYSVPAKNEIEKLKAGWEDY